MAVRKVPFVIDQYYHIYNRGVDKRSVFLSRGDLNRFFLSMHEFNEVQAIGGIYAGSFETKDQLRHPMSKLVDFVAYCLNPNHYHFILTPLVDNGVEKFMQKLGNGYTKYFNEKHDRSGPLFSGAFKASHINTDAYLLYVSAYINLNNRIHNLSEKALTLSSFGEYSGEPKSFCKREIIMDHFKTSDAYKNYALEVAKGAAERKKADTELSHLLID